MDNVRDLLKYVKKDQKKNHHGSTLGVFDDQNRFNSNFNDKNGELNHV